MTLLTQNEAKMQQLMNAVQEFEAWSGIHVNTTKTKLMAIDGIAANRTDAVTVTYRDEPLTLTPESEAVRYLGFWATPNVNMKAAMDLVFERKPGNFRYLATAPWKRRDLDRLDRLWRQG